MFIYKSGRTCYGMLAAQVNPHNKQDCVNLLLAFTQINTVRYKGTGLIHDPYVCKKLPEEYTAEILNKSIYLISQKEVLKRSISSMQHLF